MNCPSCGAPMRLEEDQDSFHCEYCKNIFFPEKNEEGVRVLGEPSGLNCPVCSTGLVHAAIGGGRILYCTGCRGMLIRMDIFPGLIQAAQAHREGPAIIPHRPDPNGLRRHIKCPQCHASMNTHFYAGPGNIIIDSCSDCYLDWLDDGELMRIVRAPDRVYGESLPDMPPDLNARD